MATQIFIALNDKRIIQSDKKIFSVTGGLIYIRGMETVNLKFRKS